MCSLLILEDSIHFFETLKTWLFSLALSISIAILMICSGDDDIWWCDRLLKLYMADAAYFVQLFFMSISSVHFTASYMLSNNICDKQFLLLIEEI